MAEYNQTPTDNDYDTEEEETDEGLEKRVRMLEARIRSLEKSRDSQNTVIEGLLELLNKMAEIAKG